MAPQPSQALRRTLLSVLLALTALSPLPRRHDVGLDKARDSFAKGDIKAAGIELKNALQKDPGNAEARLLLGELYLKLGNGLAAEKEFRRAQELGTIRCAGGSPRQGIDPARRLLGGTDPAGGCRGPSRRKSRQRSGPSAATPS